LAALRLPSFLNHEHINRLIFLFADTFVEDRREALRSETAAFEFGYDWRRSLDESAIAFEAFVHRATRFLQVQRNSVEPIRFDVVAHSMGGFVLRYFLQYGGQLLPYDGSAPRLNWAGAACLDKPVIIGTPNAGPLKIIDRLVRGIPGNPLYPTYGLLKDRELLIRVLDLFREARTGKSRC
jgi:hypothetical protein